MGTATRKLSLEQPDGRSTKGAVMQSRVLKLTLTPLEASQVMALKELLNSDGSKLSTSQVIATAVRIALDLQRSLNDSHERIDNRQRQTTG